MRNGTDFLASHRPTPNGEDIGTQHEFASEEEAINNDVGDLVGEEALGTLLCIDTDAHGNVVGLASKKLDGVGRSAGEGWETITEWTAEGDEEPLEPEGRPGPLMSVKVGEPLKFLEFA